MASPPELPSSPASSAGLSAAPLPPQSPPPVSPLAVDYSEDMHLAPGYREFLRSLIVNGGDLVDVHRATWRRAFPNESVPQTMPYGSDGDLGSEVGGASPSSEAEESSDDGSSDDGGAGGGGSSEEEEDRPLQRRRLL